MNGRERFLAACRRQPVDATPVWIMRQAGRYLPAYRALRKRHSVLELAKDSHLAAQVAALPFEVLDVDAAILFADILLPLEPMGVELTIEDGAGPRLHPAVRTPNDADRLGPVSPQKDLPFVLEEVGLLRDKLGDEKALIGFAGGPFTLASYLIEGGPSRDFSATKRFMHVQPEAWHVLMDKLAAVVGDFLRAQIRAGVDAVQLFDSWAGALSPTDYGRLAAPYTCRVMDALQESKAPRIHFATNTGAFLPLVAAAGGDVIGVDWRVPIDDAWGRLGPKMAIQGNLDPGVLAADWNAAREAAADILRRVSGRSGHVFNLGHGILPETPVEHATALCQFVHTESRRLQPEVAQ